jgi:hypothetical protein
MKRKIFAMLVLMGVSIGAQAQFGGLGGMMGGLGGMLGGRTAGGGADSSAIEKFTVDAFLINRTVSFALLQISAALGDKENIAAVKESFDKLNATTDPKDQGAVIGSIQKTYLAEAGNLLKSGEAKAKMEKLSPEMQQKVAKSLLAVGIAALRVKPMLESGSGIMQSIMTNPAQLAKLPLLKESLSLLAEVAPKMPDLITTGFAMMKSVNVNPGNPTADAKLEPITELAVPE